MSSIHPDIREKHFLGRATHAQQVHANDADERRSSPSSTDREARL